MNTPLTPRGRALPLGLLLALLWPALAAAQVQGTLEAEDFFGEAVATGDFNGDGYADLAVGALREDHSVCSLLPCTDAGSVNVLYGTAAGLDDAANQWWGQNSADVEDGASPDDYFGYALAASDFDGDGFDDLAIGVPFEDLGSHLTDAGAVNVLYGSATGLNAAGDQLWHEDASGVLGTAEAGDLFGFALTAGDFDNDGYADLAVGIPSEDTDFMGSPILHAGSAIVLYGTSAGLSSAGNQLWGQNTPGVLDNAETGDRFGRALAVGDFDNDGYADLAVGVPDEYVGFIAEAGAVNVLYGGAGAGLTVTGNQFWNQDSPGILDQAEYIVDFGGDHFGDAVATGDFNDDGFDDLAVGVYAESSATGLATGAVNVLYGGTGAGLSAYGDQFWHQDATGVLDGAEDSDLFGHALTAGDFDGDGDADLAVGVLGEDVGVSNPASAGAVNVLYGAPAGLSGNGDEFWHQDASGVLDRNETSDQFGSALAAGDFDGDGLSDLAAGVPGEDVFLSTDYTNAGAVSVLYGTNRGDGGLTSGGDQLWRQGGTGSGRLAGDDTFAGDALADEAPAEAVTAAGTTGLSEAPALALLSPAPNPFAGRTTLRFTLPEVGSARLTVYDALGRAVAVLVDEEREAGTHAVAFEAASLPAGAYVARLEAGGRALSQRLTVLR